MHAVDHAISVHVTLEDDVGGGNRNQANRQRGTVVVNGEGAVLPAKVVKQGAARIARLVDVALKLVDKFPAFLREVHLGLLGLAALGRDRNVTDRRSDHDQHDCGGDQEFDQREAPLWRERRIRGWKRQLFHHEFHPFSLQ